MQNNCDTNCFKNEDITIHNAQSWLIQKCGEQWKVEHDKIKKWKNKLCAKVFSFTDESELDISTDDVVATPNLISGIAYS